MKNRDGFTLVEIIICISILSLITIVGVKVITNGMSDDEKKSEYVELIRMETALYVEANKEIDKFKNLKDEGDFVFIQLADLIDTGLLSEEEYNPWRKGTSREFDYDLVKVYVDELNDIRIDYPTEYFEKNKEEIDIIKENVAIVKLKNNNKNANVVKLPESSIVLNEIKTKFSELSLSDVAIFMKEVQDGRKYKYEEQGYYLEDYYGRSISTDLDDWSIKTTWNSYERTWTIMYDINNESELLKKYKINGAKRLVKLIDNDGPLLLSNNLFREYGEEFIYLSYKNSLCTLLSDNYLLFDNFDGITIDVNFDNYSCSEVDITSNQTFEDSIKNYRNYAINFKVGKNSPPTIAYNGGLSYDIVSIYTEHSEIPQLQPFYNNIYVYDEEDGRIEPNYYLYNDYYWNGGYYDYRNTSERLWPNDYTLHIDAVDSDGASSFITLWINVYSNPIPYEPEFIPDDFIYEIPEDYTCVPDWSNGFCGIIDRMSANGDAWYETTDSEERARLNKENIEYGNQIENYIGYPVDYDSTTGRHYYIDDNGSKNIIFDRDIYGQIYTNTEELWLDYQLSQAENNQPFESGARPGYTCIYGYIC